MSSIFHCTSDIYCMLSFYSTISENAPFRVHGESIAAKLQINYAHVRSCKTGEGEVEVLDSGKTERGLRG